MKQACISGTIYIWSKLLALEIHKYFSTWKQFSKINWALIKYGNIRVHKGIDI